MRLITYCTFIESLPLSVGKAYSALMATRDDKIAVMLDRLFSSESIKHLHPMAKLSKNGQRIVIPHTKIDLRAGIDESELERVFELAFMLMAKNGYHIERDGLVNNEIRRPGKQYIKMTTALMKIIKDNKDPRFVDTAKIVLEFINKHADKFKSFDSAIIVSRHGYDIAGMSTGRSWKSCMRLPVNGKDGGEHYANIKDDIKYGTLVAYLVDSKDVNINKPFARVLIKPFTQGDHTIWHPESVVYPRLSVYFDFQKDLTKLVSSWMQSLQVPDGIYTKQPKLYDDDKVREITITKAGNNG